MHASVAANTHAAYDQGLQPRLNVHCHNFPMGVPGCMAASFSIPVYSPTTRYIITYIYHLSNLTLQDLRGFIFNQEVSYSHLYLCYIYIYIFAIFRWRGHGRSGKLWRWPVDTHESFMRVTVQLAVVRRHNYRSQRAYSTLIIAFQRMVGLLTQTTLDVSRADPLTRAVS